MLENAALPFVWTPGAGPDPEALLRLERRSPRPAVPMGEAWLMGSDRRLFHELVEQDPAALPAEIVADCLSEIASGTGSFGPRQEWDDWFHYLLPRLVPRSFERRLDYLVEPLVTAFMALHPRGGGEPAGEIPTLAPELRHDVLATLGQAIMAPSLWEGGEIAVGQMLHRPGRYGNGNCWGWFQASGDFSAQMFFCWKYLDPQQIDAWLQSVLAIESSHWRAQLLVWLLGARPVLTGGVTQPARLERTNPQVSWAWAHRLSRYHGHDGSEIPLTLVSEANRAAFRESLRRHLSEALVFDWIDSFDRFDYLARELDRLPDQFIREFFDHLTRGD